MNVLGVHIGHDSSVALIRDGRLIADVAEERFSRIKHHNGVPYKSLEYCLREGGITMDDVDVVAVPSKYSLPALDYLFDLHEEHRMKKRLRSHAADFYRKHFSHDLRKPPLYVRKHKVQKHTRVAYIEHHLAHAGSAYYSSGLGRTEKALILTCDGSGDGVSLCFWRGENGRITPLKQFGGNGSIGWFYSNVTEALGWIHGDGEGKTMGLAPYGDADKCRGCLDGFYPKFSGTDLAEPHEFGSVYYWDEGGSTQYHFDDADQIRKIIDKHGREDVAAEAQRVLEEQVVPLTAAWMDKEATDILCAAGGVMLNVKLNQRLWYTGRIRKHWTYPNCGDSGLAYGAAMVAYFEQNGGDIPLLQDLYSGPAYSNDEIETMLGHRGVTAQYVEGIEDAAAELLARNKIVGWFQGRMESGPRALGGRSILMSAGTNENKDVINAKVKYREAFRPFCPSVPIECAPLYLSKYRPEPFMITSFDATSERRGAIPAVVHADGTARPQTVTREANERYWTLLRRYGELSGHPVLLNTSMNIMGEPIVCNPRDALKCFFDSGMDALAMGNFLLTKNGW
jgi:carbamoyltransferase